MITLQTLNLETAERLLVMTAIELTGSLVDAAVLLGITRHAVKRRIIKHRIPWPPPRLHEVAAPEYRAAKTGASPREGA